MSTPARSSIRPEVPSRNLTEMDREALRALLCDELGEPAYRVKQIYRHVFQRGVRSIDEMTDLPKGLRARLVEAGYTVGRVTVGARTSFIGLPRAHAESVLAEWDHLPIRGMRVPMLMARPRGARPQRGKRR